MTYDIFPEAIFSSVAMVAERMLQVPHNLAYVPFLVSSAYFSKY